MRSLKAPGCWFQQPPLAWLAAAVLVGAGVTSLAIAVEPAESANPFASAIAVAQQRTVKVYGGAIGRSPGYGTGILVSADGQIVTAQGVHLASDNLRVVLSDGIVCPASVVRRSEPLQVALLKIDARTPHFFDLSSPPKAREGDWIVAVSNAFKVADGPEPLSASIGVLSSRMPLEARRGVHDFPYRGDAYLYDAITSNPGAAGGAVLTADGQLIGMIGRVIEAQATNTRLNYAVPADLLAAFTTGKETEPAAVAQSNAQKIDLGIRLFALGGRRAPAYVDRVIPSSPAATAGVRTDDLIVTINGQVVRDASEFKRISEALKPGGEISIEVKRGDRLLLLQVTPEDRP